MNNHELRTVARLLRAALGYESREVRIGKILTSPYMDVRLMAKALTLHGYLDHHTVHEKLGDPV